MSYFFASAIHSSWYLLYFVHSICIAGKNGIKSSNCATRFANVLNDTRELMENDEKFASASNTIYDESEQINKKNVCTPNVPPNCMNSI